MISVVRHLHWLARLMTAHGCALPKRATVLAVLVFERLTRRARLAAAPRRLSRSQRRELGELSARSCGLLVLMAYDDPFDQDSGDDLERRYEYLSRTLGGLLAGRSSEGPIPHDEYFDLLRRLEVVFEEERSDLSHPEDLERDRTRLWRSRFIQALDELSSVSTADFLFSDGSSPRARQRNVPIVAAIELGRSLRRLHEVFQEIGLPDRLLRVQQRAIEVRLIKAGYAQAHTVEQRDLERMSWRRYCQLALWKTNSMIEIGAFLRGCLDIDALQFRLGCNRFCEQIYLDDLFDLAEDTEVGMAGAAHVFVREQGILAATLLEAAQRVAGSSLDTDCYDDPSITASGLLDRSSEGAFLQASPLLPRAGPGGSSREERSSLKEALVNRRSEACLPRATLLHRRRRDWEELRAAWRAGDRRRVLTILHLSGVPIRLVGGFLRHLHEIRSDYLPGGRPGVSGSCHFLFLQLAARILFVRFRIAHRVASLVSRRSQRRGTLEDREAFQPRGMAHPARNTRSSEGFGPYSRS